MEKVDINFKNEDHVSENYDSVRVTVAERVKVLDLKIRMMDRVLEKFVEACPDYVPTKALWDSKILNAEHHLELVRNITKSVREVTRHKPDYFKRFALTEKLKNEDQSFQFMEVLRKNADIIQSGGLLMIAVDIMDDLESGMGVLYNAIHQNIINIGDGRWSLDKELEFLYGLIGEELEKWEKRLEKRFADG